MKSQPYLIFVYITDIFFLQKNSKKDPIIYFLLQLVHHGFIEYVQNYKSCYSPRGCGLVQLFFTRLLHLDHSCFLKIDSLIFIYMRTLSFSKGIISLNSRFRHSIKKYIHIYMCVQGRYENI